MYRKAIMMIIKKNDLYLIVKHNMSSQWAFPGGGIERGESYIDTMIRECFEEFGIKNEDFLEIKDTGRHHKYELPKRFRNGYEGQNRRLIVGEVLDPKIKVNRDEITHYKWVSFEDVCKMIPFEDFISFLKELKNDGIV